MTDKNNPFKGDMNETLEEQNQQQEIDEINEEIQEETSKEDSKSEESDNKVDEINEKYEILNQQYIRLAADFDNYRKRQEQERESLLRYGTENALKKLIEVLDNFERGQKALANIDDCQKVKESFDLVHKQTIETLTKLGLEQIEAEGQEFDPNFHEAVMQTPTTEHAENTIINELQKGYKMGDKVLRASLVNVATAG